jgi:hypothetical protein
MSDDAQPRLSLSERWRGWGVPPEKKKALVLIGRMSSPERQRVSEKGSLRDPAIYEAPEWGHTEEQSEGGPKPPASRDAQPQSKPSPKDTRIESLHEVR